MSNEYRDPFEVYLYVLPNLSVVVVGIVDAVSSPVVVVISGVVLTSVVSTSVVASSVVVIIVVVICVVS